MYFKDANFAKKIDNCKKNAQKRLFCGQSRVKIHFWAMYCLDEDAGSNVIDWWHIWRRTEKT